MTDQKPTTRYTITAAHRITGRSRTTIQKHLKKGKLSYVEDEAGVKRIDASELIRVYGDDCDFSREDAAAGKPTASGGGAPTATDAELTRAREQLTALQEERHREREQLQAQIEHLREALKLAQEGHNRATLLLEHRSGGGELGATVEQLRTQLGELKEEARQEALQEVRRQPWWRIAFG